MASPEPVLISYFKLPPDEHLFFRLKEIAELFQEKLEQLTYALAAAQNPEETEPLAPEVDKLLEPLRRLAYTQCKNVSVNIHFLKEFVDGVLTLVQTLSTHSLEEVIDLASSNAHSWDESEKEMKTFSREIAATVKKITVVLDADERAKPAIVFNETNSRAVSDFIRAAQDACEVERKVASYLRETVAHFKDGTRQSQTPLPEEVRMMSKRWNEFKTTMEPFNIAMFAAIQSEIQSGPDLVQARSRADFWKNIGVESPFAMNRQRSSEKKSTTLRETSRPVVLDSSAQDQKPSSSRSVAAPFSPPQHQRHKPAFFQTLFKRIISPFSSKRSA